MAVKRYLSRKLNLTNPQHPEKINNGQKLAIFSRSLYLVQAPSFGLQNLEMALLPMASQFAMCWPHAYTMYIYNSET